jgi:hypothetical protein
MTLPTVEQYFSQFAETGKIWPGPGLEVRLRNTNKQRVMLVLPGYSEGYYLVWASGAGCWTIRGSYFDCEAAQNEKDIIAVYEDGELVASNEPAANTLGIKVVLDENLPPGAVMLHDSETLETVVGK